MQTVKILIILLSPIPSPGAAWSRVGFFANYLRNENNFKVTIFGSFTPKSMHLAGSETWNGIKIYRYIPTLSLLDPISFVINFIVSAVISFFCYLWIRPSYILISVPGTGTPLGCYLAARLLRINIISDYRDEWEDFLISIGKSNASKALFKWQKKKMTNYYKRCKIMITVTRPLDQSLALRGVKKVVVLPNGADINIFRPSPNLKGDVRERLGFGQDDIILIYSGYIGGYYRIDIIVELFPRILIAHKYVKLVIIGRGSGVSNLLSLIHKLGLEGHVSYLGVKSDSKEISEILSACDAGIVPYDSNPLWRHSIPVKSLEYLACGLPVFATVDTDSELGHLIKDNNVGLTALPEDQSSIYNGIVDFISQIESREFHHDNAFTLIKNMYDRNKIAFQLVEIIKKDTFGNSK